jgi:hypothetical protein
LHIALYVIVQAEVVREVLIIFVKQEQPPKKALQPKKSTSFAAAFYTPLVLI